MKFMEGGLSAEGMRFCIVVSRREVFFGEQLLAGAKDSLLRHGVSHRGIDVLKTPSPWEMPLAAKEAALSGRYDAIIALGIETAGDHENRAVYESLASICLAQRVPISLGILPSRLELPISEACNRGSEAATAAIEMANLLKQMRNIKEAVADA
ncbi:MAG: 6,7-dimethyl-8-ribityllumazine synthase [Synergistota bacterium]|nr:6,7-dimethyl-8-ribityllumazine synthase [Synergistota bacterium]